MIYKILFLPFVLLLTIGTLKISQEVISGYINCNNIGEYIINTLFLLAFISLGLIPWTCLFY
jgi:hypothetical protein